MTIYCPLAEKFGIQTSISILDIESRYETYTRKGIIPSLRKGVPHTEETKQLIREKKMGKSNGPHSEQTRKKIGAGNKGKVRTPEMNERNRQWHLGRTFKLKDSVKEKQRQTALNRPRYECPVCGKKMTKQCFDRYGHGPNCKQEKIWP